MKTPKARTLIIVGIILLLITLISPAHTPYAILFFSILLIIALICIISGVVMVIRDKRYGKSRG